MIVSNAAFSAATNQIFKIQQNFEFIISLNRLLPTKKRSTNYYDSQNRALFSASRNFFNSANIIIKMKNKVLNARYM